MEELKNPVVLELPLLLGLQLKWGVAYTNEASVSHKNSPTLSFDEILPVWSNSCDGPVRVPQFTCWMLYGYMVFHFQIGELVGVLVIC